MHLFYHWLFPWAWWSFVAYWTIYSWKIRREERLLAGEFGEEYAVYCRTVPALVPFKLNSRS